MSMPEESRRATTRLDPRSPLVLDTRELGRRPGSMRTVSRTVPAPAHLGVDVLGVPEGPRSSWTSGSSRWSRAFSSPARCTPRVGRVRALPRPGQRPRSVVDLQELYAYPGHEQPTDDDDTEPLPGMEGDLIDLEPALRDAVVLALPLRPLCREDCPGLCPDVRGPARRRPGARARGERPAVGGAARTGRRHDRHDLSSIQHDRST